MPTAIPVLYCLRVRAEALPGLRYVFSVAKNEARSIDADIQIPYDIDYETDSDATESTARLFSWSEAEEARERVLRVLSGQLEWHSTPKAQVDLLAVDQRDSVSTFDAETCLLRLLPFWSREGEAMEGFSFAWASSREDGARVDCKRLLYRRCPQPAHMCFAVHARRTAPGLEAQVTARYGNRYRNIDGPRARVERFGFVEWGYPSSDMETEMCLVAASRALTEEQANAIADSLRDDPDFADVSVVARPFSKFAAGEGLRSGGSVVFAQATDERQELLGFPHFLSVWPVKAEG